MVFKKYRATRRNVELLREALNDLGYTTYEDYATDEALPVKHSINGMSFEYFKYKFWNKVYSNEINYKMQELERMTEF